MPRSTVTRSLRAEHLWRAPAGVWAFDTWGDTGRPVLLLHATQLDRAAWWPVAAELAGDHTVIAIDLPGHGQSAARATYHADAIIEELAELVHQLGVRRAPIVVGHADAAILATLFAAAFTTHAVVNVQQSLQIQNRPSDLLIDAEMPPSYQHLLVVDGQPHDWLSTGTSQHQLTAALKRIAAPCLNVFSALPWPDYPAWLTRLAPTARCVEYGGDGDFPHLADQPRFVADIRALG